LQIDLTQN